MEPTLGALVQGYFFLKSVIDQEEAKLAEKLKPYRERLEKIKTLAHQKLLDEKVKSYAMENGTVYLQERKSVKVEDWETFYQFVREQNRLDFLERRPSLDALTTWVEEGHELPSGVVMGGIVQPVFRKKTGG